MSHSLELLEECGSYQDQEWLSSFGIIIRLVDHVFKLSDNFLPLLKYACQAKNSYSQRWKKCFPPVVALLLWSKIFDTRGSNDTFLRWVEWKIARRIYTGYAETVLINSVQWELEKESYEFPSIVLQNLPDYYLRHFSRNNNTCESKSFVFSRNVRRWRNCTRFDQFDFRGSGISLCPNSQVQFLREPKMENYSRSYPSN